MTLRELRKARKLTQVRMGSSLESRRTASRFLRSAAIFCCPTLRKTVEAMGENLLLVAEFPDPGPAVLSGIDGAE